MSNADLCIAGIMSNFVLVPRESQPPAKPDKESPGLGNQETLITTINYLHVSFHLTYLKELNSQSSFQEHFTNVLPMSEM